MARALYITVALFVAATIYLLSTVNERQAVLRHVAHHNDAWAVSQAVQEVLRLENAIARNLLEDKDSRSDIRLRLDIVISRLASLQKGTLGAFLAEMQPRRQTLANLSTIIDNLDETLETIDDQELQWEFETLNTLIGPLTNLPAQAVQHSWAIVEENLKSLEKLHRIFGVVVAILIACWCGLLFLLLRHNRLLDLAQKEGKILYNDLKAAGSELRHKNKSLEYAAHHDPLTALPNRVLFWKELETSFQTSPSGVSVISLLLLDLDDFKTINDTMGHDFGDLLLHEVSERMRRFSTKPHMFCRLGGDEFACLLIGKTAEECLAYARDLVADIVAPYQLFNRRAQIGCSIGIATTEGASEINTQLLFKRADIALYCAKASDQERVCLFEYHMQKEFDDRKALEEDFRLAIKQRKIDVAYQIQVDIQSGELRGVEALARWTHPLRGPIPAPVFVSIAEEIGLINELGLLVLTEACAEAITWYQPIKVAVNLSSLQLQSSDLFNIVKNVLKSTGLDPRRLELEITESVLLDKREEVFQALYHLRHLGITVAMDDFGTGYSSLANLRDIPFDTIKLDKTFMSDIASDQGTQALVKFVNDLGGLLKKEVIIEGVETDEQYEVVRRLQCKAAQGFLFGHPVPASHLGHLRRQNGPFNLGNIA